MRLRIKVLNIHTLYKFESAEMCDTLVAVGRATLRGNMIFGKNSDRPPNESQPLLYRPRLRQEKNMVKCQNIEIPQVPVTYAHIGSRPYWLWGYEHGVNEFHVAIGNLGVHSKEPYENPPDSTGLIGMDLVRLGLERGKTAHEAVLTLTSLLEKHGAGYCAIPQMAEYHNNYMIADPCEAWVLETAGRYWVAKRVSDGFYHEGNLYSIQTDWDLSHPELLSHAVEAGYCGSESDFDFAKAYGDYEKHPITGSMIRYRRGTQLLKKHAGRITPETMMEILRDHLEDTLLEPPWTPGENFYSSICCHEAPWRSGQTAASMVVELRDSMPEPLKTCCWASMAAPCTSVFMPLYPRKEAVPVGLSQADEEFSEDSPWWLFKKLQRHTERNYPVLAVVVRSIWKKTEEKMISHRTCIERSALRLINNGEESKAEKLLREYVKTQVEKVLEQARSIEKLLYNVGQATGEYEDLRRAYLDLLNRKAGIYI